VGDLARASVPLALASPARAQRAPGLGRERPQPFATVALHYMTWLDDSLWPIAGTQPITDPRTRAPAPYSVSDPGVFRRQNAQAEAHGFVWLWSWWGRGAVGGGDGVLRSYLASDPASPVQLIILYEARGLLAVDADGFFSFDDPQNQRRFVDDMAYLGRSYFDNPAYAGRFFRIDGRACVFPWVSRNFTGAWPAAVATARQQASFYLVGAEFGLELEPDGLTPHVRGNLAEVCAPLDAVSAYGIYDPQFVPPSGHLDASYTSRYQRSIRGWSQLLGRIAPNVAFIPPLQYAFDDHLARPTAHHPTLTSDPDEALAVAHATRSLIEDARAGDPRYRNVLPVVFCVSWNEHVEGTAIEWTVEHGYAYLQATATSFRE